MHRPIPREGSGQYRRLCAGVKHPRSSGASTLQWHELDDHLASGGILLDVRTPEEAARGGIGGAVHIPLDELRQRLAELPKDKTICVMCGVGLRAYLACRILTAKWFSGDKPGWGSRPDPYAKGGQS